MTAPGIVILLFGLLVLGSEIDAYTSTPSLASLIVAGASGLGLLASGIAVFKGKQLGFVFAPLITLILIAFYACRLVLGGDFIPSGLMGILGFVVLVLYCALPAKEISDQRRDDSLIDGEFANGWPPDELTQHRSDRSRADPVA